MDKGVCRSCGASILWAKTTGGKAIPLDVQGERRFVIADQRSTRVDLTVTYQTHFATCPNASEHRTR